MNTRVLMFFKNLCVLVLWTKVDFSIIGRVKLKYALFPSLIFKVIIKADNIFHFRHERVNGYSGFDLVCNVFLLRAHVPQLKRTPKLFLLLQGSFLVLMDLLQGIPRVINIFEWE